MAEADGSQRPCIGLRHRNHTVRPGHTHIPAHHCVEPVNRPQKRGFAGAGEAHEHQYLALFNLKRAVMHAQDLPCGRVDLGTFLPLIHQGQSILGLVPKDDGDIVENHSAHDRFTRNMRSRMMATTTITSPLSKPKPLSTRFSALTTGLPNPLAPTNAEITTIDSDSMIVWFSPAMICGKAEGSSTFHRSCRLVAPNASAASISGVGVLDTPRWVNRMGAGRTKITVATSPGTSPSPKNTMAGMRYTKVGSVCMMSSTGSTKE
mmetsp:Transcript_18153/g.28309  ORF Transcript_18153/g.28309 Transcript_18153/m.28309 type:complete len:263 (-) Transcript_18153:436-1224(-)